MPSLSSSRDAALVQIVDATSAAAVRRGGHWIACRPGCTDCCFGPFEITALDAARLRRGLAALDQTRGAAVRARAARYRSGDDEPCPALDPASGLCDLYESRPLMCRLFGPALRWNDGAVRACELCYDGAADDEIAELAGATQHELEEAALLAELNLPETTVAGALLATGELN